MDSDEEVLQHAVEGDPFFSAKKFMRDLDDEGYEFTHVVSPEGKITYLPQFDPRNFPKDDMDEGDNMSTFEALNRMKSLAGVKVNESLLDESGEALDHVLDRFKHEVKNFQAGGDLDQDLYHALYDYYTSKGEMPYGVAKARDGDPYNWVADKLGQEIGIEENLIAPVAMPVATEGSTCNMTAEGEYCPEHGLTECGMGAPAGLMGEGDVDEGWKGALAGGLAGAALGSVVPGFGTLPLAAAGAYAGHKMGDEGFKDPDAEYKKAQKLKQQQAKDVAEGSNDDPMNYNAAITGNYYESKDGDALLARIKSLALLK
jgi:hypothetical protein